MDYSYKTRVWGASCFQDDLIQKLDNELCLLQQPNHHLMLLSTVHDPPARNVNLINLDTADLKKGRKKKATPHCY